MYTTLTISTLFLLYYFQKRENLPSNQIFFYSESSKDLKDICPAIAKKFRPEAYSKEKCFTQNTQSAVELKNPMTTIAQKFIVLDFDFNFLKKR